LTRSGQRLFGEVGSLWSEFVRHHLKNFFSRLKPFAFEGVTGMSALGSGEQLALPSNLLNFNVLDMVTYYSRITAG
jgi:hypothetical protein